MSEPLSSREKILDVAEALFARSGYAGVGLKEVADRVGLGKSSLFHHFRSKQELYGEVLDRVLLRIGERLDPVLGATGDPVARLSRTIEALVDALAEVPTTARLLLRALFEDETFGTDTPPELLSAEKTLARILTDVSRLLTEGVERGVLRPVSVPDTLQSLIGACVYHFASSDVGETIVGGPLFSAEAVARRRRELVDLFHRGLVLRPDAAAHP
ncbi:MAG: TetR/AcrR family transcriptional regulator [Myxococcota bacterium]